MSNQLHFLNIIRILSAYGDPMPVELLALKSQLAPSGIVPLLRKLEQIKVVKLDLEAKRVSLLKPDEIPTMSDLYSLAG